MSIAESWTNFFYFALVTFASIFMLVNPFSKVPTLLALTSGRSMRRRRLVARRASWTCFLVLTTFALAGSLIFRLFGITLPAFKIAGGLILLQIGLDMIHGKTGSTSGPAPEDAAEAFAKSDPSIIPLGIPMLAGPGTISTVMVLVGKADGWGQHIVVYLAVIATSLLSYWVLASADRVSRVLGDTGIRILVRLMGLLLAALAVQFILNGVSDFLITNHIIKG